MTADQLRLEQLAETAHIQRTTWQHRRVVGWRGMRRALPLLHEFDEVLVDDLGAVEALVTGTDGNGVGHGVRGFVWRVGRKAAFSGMAKLAGWIPDR